MSVVTPQPILRHLLDRLYLNYVPDTLFSEDDVLVMLNDAYLEACERSMCLRDLAQITLIAGQQEYDLPDDFSQAVFVVAGGFELQPLPLGSNLVPRSVTRGYYLYDHKIGFAPSPSDDDASAMVLLLYAAKPSPFATYDDGLDPRYPIEFSDILLHYVRWRVLLMSQGAESIRTAGVDRNISATRIQELRRTVDTVEMVASPRLTHVNSKHRVWAHR